MLTRLIMFGAVPPADAVGITVTVSMRPKPGFALGTPATFCGDGAAGVDDCALGAGCAGVGFVTTVAGGGVVGCGTMTTWGGGGSRWAHAAIKASAAREADTETILRMKSSWSVYRSDRSNLRSVPVIGARDGKAREGCAASR